MSSVRKMNVRGFKSIRELKDFDLSEGLNVLIGANGAGKSNLIDLFGMLNAIYEQRLQVYVQKQGGPDSILHFGREKSENLFAQFSFERNAYEFTLTPTADNRLIFEEEYSTLLGMFYNSTPSAFLGTGHSESKLKEAEDTYSPYVRDSVSNWRVYHFHDTSENAKVKQRHNSNDTLRLKIDAANLGPYLQMLWRDHNGAYRRIVSTIRLVAPFFDDFIHRPENTEYVELEWTQIGNPDTPLKAHIFSDGTLRFICLATLLLQPLTLLPETILIDEPELGLHPYAIAVLADIFKQIAEDRQLIVSTQSVELVNELSPEDIIVVDQEDGASTFKRYGVEKLRPLLEEYSLGELWKRNVLGGRP